MGTPTSEVWLLDSRTHTWHYIPSMAVPRTSPAAGVLGGKIYEFGGCEKVDSLDWTEVFDPKTQTWDSLPPMPDRKIRKHYIHDSMVVRKEKLYAVVEKLGKEQTYYFSPTECQWGRAKIVASPHRKVRDWCVINNLIYCIDGKGSLCWCEPEQLEGEQEGMYWRKVRGLSSLKKTLSTSRLVEFVFDRDKELIDLLPGARLCNSGGNILLFWDVVHEGHLEIWFAEISLERRKGPEMWGNIVASHSFLTVDPFVHHYKVLHSVSVTL